MTLGWMSRSSQGVGEMVLAQGKESVKVMPWIGAVLAWPGAQQEVLVHPGSGAADLCSGAGLSGVSHSPLLALC